MLEFNPDSLDIMRGQLDEFSSPLAATVPRRLAPASASPCGSRRGLRRVPIIGPTYIHTYICINGTTKERAYLHGELSQPPVGRALNCKHRAPRWSDGSFSQYPCAIRIPTGVSAASPSGCFGDAATLLLLESPTLRHQS